MSRHIFCDCGVWNGISTKLFFAGKLGVDPKDYIAYGFDPLKKYLPEIKQPISLPL